MGDAKVTVTLQLNIPGNGITQILDLQIVKNDDGSKKLFWNAVCLDATQDTVEMNQVNTMTDAPMPVDGCSDYRT